MLDNLYWKLNEIRAVLVMLEYIYDCYIFATYDQNMINKIFKAAATAADKARIPLAKMAVADTGMGVVEDKIIKGGKIRG